MNPPRAHVNDPVGMCHHGLVMFDHDDGLALVDETVKHREHVVHVGEMQAGAGFVEDVDAAIGHLGGKLQTLTFPT